jgi:hypothetical protein
MNKVAYFDFDQTDGTKTTVAIVDLGDGQFQSIPKADYEAQQVEAKAAK